MVGKWHLGHANKKFWPQNRGFDYFYGNVVGEVDYFTHQRAGVTDWQRNGKFIGAHASLIVRGDPPNPIGSEAQQP